MKSKKFARSRVMIFAMMLLPLLSGCSIEELERALGLDVPKEALFVLSFHRTVAYPRGNLQAEQIVLLPDGSSRIVERYPLMSSHNIVEVAAQPVPGKAGFYRLFFRPDQKGRMMWMQLTMEAKHDPATVLLDGIYFGDFRTVQVGRGNEIWLELPLDVDTVRAQNIVKYGNDNYRFFNGGKREDKSDPFGAGGK